MNGITVSIVSFNTRDLIEKCLKTLLVGSNELLLQTIVVDNGSDDGSPQLIEEIFKDNPKLNGILIKNKNNAGFAKANNQAIRKAKYDHILLLNSDAFITKDQVYELLKYAKKFSNAGGVVPRLINADGSTQMSVRKLPTVIGAIKEYFLGMKNEYEFYAPKGDEVQVEFASFACFLLTPDAIAKVKMLDEKYFFYYEDIDFCKRLKDADLPIYYVTKVSVTHLMGQSGKAIADDKNQWRRLIAGSKRYHGFLVHNLLFLIIWSAQKFKKGD